VSGIKYIYKIYKRVIYSLYKIRCMLVILQQYNKLDRRIHTLMPVHILTE